MAKDLSEAAARLREFGLHVSAANSGGLWIAAHVAEDNGIRYSQDACTLAPQGTQYVAVFPAGGTQTYQFPGELPTLVPMIEAVYARLRRSGGSLKQAFQHSVQHHERYLTGQFLSAV